MNGKNKQRERERERESLLLILPIFFCFRDSLKVLVTSCKSFQSNKMATDTKKITTLMTSECLQHTRKYIVERASQAFALITPGNDLFAKHTVYYITFP